MAKYSLATKKGFLYGVYSYKDNNGNYRQKWINTGLKERGNKKEAQRIIEAEIEKIEKNNLLNIDGLSGNSGNYTFIDWLQYYVDSKKNDITEIVYLSYNAIIEKIRRYYKSINRNPMLKDITTKDIMNLYDYFKSKGLKNISIKHYRTVIHPAMRMAYRDGYIDKNPVEFIPSIKREKIIHTFYNEQEMEMLFHAIKGLKTELVYKIAAYYGFRRSEILGLKWSAINFEDKTISIETKLLEVAGRLDLTEKLKTESSRRILPLLPEIEEDLLKQKKWIDANREKYGDCYCNKYIDCVFVNDIGEIIRPDYITKEFSKILKKNNLRHIRFHDLRHSCASLMIKHGNNMKFVQEWLGHANYNTTADVYSHLDFSSKQKSAEIIEDIFKFGDRKSEQDLDAQIDELTKLLEELKKQKKKEQEQE